MQKNYEFSVFQTFLAFFRETLGDLELLDEFQEELDFKIIFLVFFFLSILFLFIIMLNLLISLVSDTFQKVKKTEKLTNVWEKWNIVTEIDLMLPYIYIFNPWHKYLFKSNLEKNYLMFLYNEQHLKKTEEEESEHQIKRLENKIKKIEKTCNNLEARFEENNEILRDIHQIFKKK